MRSGATPRQPTGLEERGLHGNVCLRLVQALLNRSDRVPDLESEIPAGTYKALVGRIRIGNVRPQQQQIYIGIWVHLTAPVAADRDECGVGRDREASEKRPQGTVRCKRKLPQEAPRLSVLVKLCERRIA